MRFTSHILSCIVIALLFTGCGRDGGTHVSKTSFACPKMKVYACLVTPTRYWKSGQDLPLILMIVNGGTKPLRIDKRMSWPGNIKVYAKLPSSRVISASRIAVKLSQPSLRDIISLSPHMIYGRELRIETTDRNIGQELRHPKPGVYTFWIEFYQYPNTQLAIEGLSLTTNQVVVERL